MKLTERVNAPTTAEIRLGVYPSERRASVNVAGGGRRSTGHRAWYIGYFKHRPGISGPVPIPGLRTFSTEASGQTYLAHHRHDLQVLAAMPQQHDERPGEILAELGRWTRAGIRRLQALDASERIEWNPGVLANVATIARTAVGNIHRHRREHPWIVRIDSFEWWLPPTRILPYWHYSQVRAIPEARAAKFLLCSVIEQGRELTAGNGDGTTPDPP